MPWIQLHSDLVDHPKTLIYQSELGVGRVSAIGSLASLWLWTIRHAEDGNLSRFSVQQIAMACGYEASSGEKVYEALVKAGFLDKDGTLHDWKEYAGRYLAIKKYKGKRKTSGSPAKMDVTDTGCVRGDRVPSEFGSTESYSAHRESYKKVMATKRINALTYEGWMRFVDSYPELDFNGSGLKDMVLTLENSEPVRNPLLWLQSYAKRMGIDRARANQGPVFSQHKPAQSALGNASV